MYEENHDNFLGKLRRLAYDNDGRNDAWIVLLKEAGQIVVEAIW